MSIVFIIVMIFVGILSVGSTVLCFLFCKVSQITDEIFQRFFEKKDN